MIIATIVAAVIFIISIFTIVCCSLYYGYYGTNKWCDKIADILVRLSIVGMIVSVFALAVIAILTIISMAQLVV